MAALVQSLYFAGSRLSDGAPNDTGTVYAYIPGTTNPATLYSDADATVAITQPITLDAGGRIPYSTYPDGVWITAPVRLFVQDVDGNTVSDAAFWPADARDTALVNDGFTGDTVDQALSALFASTGGQDAKYLESGGATERPIQDKFREIHISVKDFGAVGDGIAIDTVPIQQAVNRVAALGGGIVYFPPGTYKIDQTITLTSGTAVYIAGAGIGTSVIRQASATGNVFSLVSCSSSGIRAISLLADVVASVPAISLTSCNSTMLDSVHVASGLGTWAYAIQTVTAGSLLSIRNSTLFAVTASVQLVAQGTFWIRDSYISGGSGIGIDLQTTTQNGVIGGCTFFSGQATGVKFNGNLSVAGAAFTIEGCPSLGANGAITTPIDVDSLTVGLRIRQFGNNTDYRFNQVATGSSITPIIIAHDVIQIQAITGAGTVTVAAPPILPPETNRLFRFQFMNGAGGAVTWTLNAIFKVTAAIPTTDGHTIEVLFAFDSQTTKLREVSRADTTT